MDLHAPIVVGVDFSAAGAAAVEWALDAASRHDVGLRLVHIREPAFSDFGFGGSDEFVSESQISSDRQKLDDCMAQARRSCPGLDVTGTALLGSAQTALVEQSDGASMLVVGNRGAGGFAGLLLGSTAMHVATHARCAVVTVPLPVRDAETATGVVVGLRSSHDSHVLEFAFREAQTWDESVTVVHAWRPPRRMGPGRTMSEIIEAEDAENGAADRMTAALRSWTTRYPDLKVCARSAPGHPAKTLIDLADGARLLVVGTRGRGDLRRLALGSVSHALIHHAHRPVAVVPDASSGDPTTRRTT
jgi:nucleotide-binding universal stress UspA family protein